MRLQIRIRKSIYFLLFFSLGFLLGVLFSNFLQNYFVSPFLKEHNFLFSFKKVKEKNEDLPENNFEERKIEILASFEELRDNFIFKKEPLFVEVNFPDMKIRVYKEGEIKKEFKILVIGDRENWGGTPAGLYKIISKQRLAYSKAAGVYMPYAVNFYGKYFIHGIPYYSDGNKRITDITGGCIQLSDSDAKDFFEIIKENTPIIVIDKYSDNYDFYTKKEKITDFPQISANAYLVADLDSGFILAEKNANEKYPIASLTKLMTAVVVSENINLKEFISIREDMLKAPGSTNELVPGKKFNVVDLFYPLLVESSNDAAEVLGNFLGKERTVKLMNEKAKSILMEETTFVDLHGFSPENVSTARDLFYLTRYIFNNRLPILRITKGEIVRFYSGLNFKYLDNKNIFYNEENFIGGKTGYIKASNYNGIFLMKFRKNNTEKKVVIIILGSPQFLYGEKSLKTETKKVIDWINENFFIQENN